MDGITIYTDSLKTVFNDKYQLDDLLYNEHRINNIKFKRCLNSKFADDKVFFSDQQIFVLTDGLILNSKELKIKYSSKNNFELIKKMYEKNGPNFFTELRGDVSLILFDITKDTLFAYTNFTGSKPLYFYFSQSNNKICISSNPYKLTQILKQNNIKLTPNIDAFYSALLNNFLLGSDHFTNEISKLTPGHYLEYNGSKITIIKYHELKNFPISQSSDEKSIERMEDIFRHAVKLQFDKDLEYDYQHISTLSGGFDSRMTTLVAKELGYTVDTLTVSRDGDWDSVIAKEVAKRHNLKNITVDKFNLESNTFYDQIFSVDGGLVSSHIASEMVGLYESVDLRRYGMIHSGQVGASIRTAMTEYKYPLRYAPLNISNSDIYYKVLEQQWKKELEKYETYEIAKFYNRVFNFTMKGNWLCYQYSETSSPFMFQEFMEYGLKIPLTSRWQNNLYTKWIDKYHKEFGYYFYDSTKRRTLPLTKNRYINFINHKFRKINYLSNGLKEKSNFNENQDIQFYEVNDFNSSVDIISDNLLKENIRYHYASGEIHKKLSALNCLKAYQFYFG